MKANNVDKAIELLEGIVTKCKANNDPRGLFVALYVVVTKNIRMGI